MPRSGAPTKEDSMSYPMSPGRWARRRAVTAIAVGTLAAGTLTTTTLLAHAAATASAASPTATPTPSGSTPTPTGHRQAEKLDRGLISVRSGSANLVSWRLLAGEPLSTGF